jgi:hypothetical protein
LIAFKLLTITKPDVFGIFRRPLKGIYQKFFAVKRLTRFISKSELIQKLSRSPVVAQKEQFTVGDQVIEGVVEVARLIQSAIQAPQTIVTLELYVSYYSSSKVTFNVSYVLR